MLSRGQFLVEEFLGNLGVPFSSLIASLIFSAANLHLFNFAISLPGVSAIWSVAVRDIVVKGTFNYVIPYIPEGLEAYTQVLFLQDLVTSAMMVVNLAVHVVLSKFPVGYTIKNSLNKYGIVCPENMSRLVGWSNGGKWQNLVLTKDPFVTLWKLYSTNDARLQEDCRPNLI